MNESVSSYPKSMQDKSNRKPIVWIAGGHGFVGHEIAALLNRKGVKACLLSRRSAMHTDYTIVQTDYTRDDLAIHFKPADSVINLIGILNERGFNGKGFEMAHVDTTRAIIDACKASDVKRYLHMSALHASTRGPSHYLISKAKAEDLVTQSGLDFTIFRPSVIFGANDSFTNRFAKLIKLSPFVFPLACPDSRFQPICVNDVAQSFLQALTLPETVNQSYDLCGPAVYKLREIVELIAKTMNKKLKVIGLGDGMSKLQASILQFIPGKPFSMDNYKSLKVDSVCTSRQNLPFSLSNARLEDAIKQYL